MARKCCSRRRSIINQKYSRSKTDKLIHEFKNTEGLEATNDMGNKCPFVNIFLKLVWIIELIYMIMIR